LKTLDATVEHKLAQEEVGLSGFKWLDCDHLAIDSLTDAATEAYCAIRRSGFDDNKRRNRRAASRSLLLCLAAQSPYGDAVGLPRRYNKKLHDEELGLFERFPYGYEGALEALEQGGWIINPIGSNGAKESKGLGGKGESRLEAFQLGKGTIAWPYNKDKAVPGGWCLSLKSWELLYACGWLDGITLPTKEYTIKVRKDGQIGLPTVPQLQGWQDDIHAYHQDLPRFKFALDGNPRPIADFFLARTFNDYNCDVGGRFYTAFSRWRSEDRKRLTIDGFEVVEHDYSALHLRLLFAITGQTPPEALNDEYDAYRLGHLANFERDDVGDVIRAAIAADNNTGISQKVKTKVDAKADDGVSVYDAILAMVKAMYPQVRGALGRGLWGLLQRADSRAVEVFIKGFTGAGRPILPVHDGFYTLPVDQDLFHSLMPQAQAAMYDEIERQLPAFKTKLWARGLPPMVRNPIPMALSNHHK
jgi:hypothetical protein